MKIGICVRAMHTDGNSSTAFVLADTLLDAGHDVTLLSPLPGQAAAEAPGRRWAFIGLGQQRWESDAALIQRLGRTFADQQFDVLLLDAFSGDSVPVHLLTREAFQIYQRHMKPDGIIAVHVSNRYLELAPVVNKIAAAVGMRTSRIVDASDGDVDFTDYVLVTNNAAFLTHNPDDAQGFDKNIPVSLWTDRRHNLFEILDK